jgi:putative nucleotidyltransferase with HDIG domain
LGELRLGGAKRLAENVVEEFWFGDDDPVRTHLQASSSLAATTAVAAGLKPFPVIAQRVLSLSQNASTSAAELSRLIERDPGLSAKVLHVANSAIYAPSRSCTSIENATVRLGMRNIGRIVAMLVAYGMFDDVNPTGAQIRDHCVGVSILARYLAADARTVEADDLFLAGLLHDVGKLLAMQTKDIDYAELEGRAHSFPEETHLKERQLVGWDHAILGAHVIEHWQLPREIAQIVAWHHQPGRAFAQGGKLAQSVAILRLADRVEYQIGIQLELDDDFIDGLERGSCFEYTNYSGALLRAAWPRLVDALDEGQRIIGARS